MARRLSCRALILAAGLAVAAGRVPAIEPAGLLVSFSFEEEGLATGPDTFTIFEHARGSVELSHEMSISGWSSIRVEDAPGDGDFPELLGPFPLRRSGMLYVHFGLLVTNPDEELNVALAGPRGFALGRDGITFWLRLLDGELRHVSDSIARRLVRVRPFTWYGVDVAMNLDAGSYDLTLREEGLREPVVRLAAVANAASAPASAVDRFSFVGDLPASDRSQTVYYVDDVLVGVDEAIVHTPFVAPGRRRLFFDRCWRERRPGEPPVACPAEGRAGDEAARIFDDLMRRRTYDQALEVARQVLAGGDAPEAATWEERAAAAAHFLGLGAEAERHLEQALAAAPARPSALLALADLAFERGDLAAERRWRESIYGSLDASRRTASDERAPR